MTLKLSIFPSAANEKVLEINLQIYISIIIDTFYILQLDRINFLIPPYFSNGSVKVIFKVIVKVLKPSKETNDVVAVKIGRKINKQIKTGRIGNIQVVPDAIKLKGNDQ